MVISGGSMSLIALRFRSAATGNSRPKPGPKMVLDNDWPG